MDGTRRVEGGCLYWKMLYVGDLSIGFHTKLVGLTNVQFSI